MLWPWSLHTDLDVELIKNGLIYRGFEEKNIIVLQNSKASKKAILDTFTSITNNLKYGDIFYFHFSGHGQQICDDNKDEIDGYDESLVCYAAKNKSSKSYNGEEHIRDDNLKKIIQELRKKTGSKGNIFFTIDACNSESMSREIKQEKKYGKFITSDCKNKLKEIRIDESGFDFTKEDNKVASFIIFSASMQHKKNKEIKISGTEDFIGPLSYFLYKGLTNKNIRTYKALFEHIKISFANNTKGQFPTAEGELNNFLFSDKISTHKQYSIIEKIENDSIVIINNGKLANITKGTILGIYNQDTQNQNESSKKADAVVIEAKAFSSRVKINKKINKKELKKMRFFIEKRQLQPHKIKLYMSYEIYENKYLLSVINKSKFILLESDSSKADIIVSQKIDNDSIKLSFYYTINKYNHSVKLINHNIEIKKKIMEICKNYNKTVILKNLEINNDKFKISAEVLPASNKKLGYFVFQSKQILKIKINNNSDYLLYYQLIDFQPDNKPNLICPYTEYRQSPTDFKLEPKGGSMEISLDISPPYGLEHFKIIASSQPLYQLPSIIEGISRNFTQEYTEFENFLTALIEGNEISYRTIVTNKCCTYDFVIITKQ